ncbi:MAG: ribosome assembly RNA-binding protein YhbY [bacterium]
MTEDDNTNLVKRLSPHLTPKQRQFLRSLAHDLKPIVLIGQKGVTEGVVDNLAAALLAHELVKVKVHDADEAEPCAEALHEGTKGQLVQHIGKTLLFYKAHPQKPEIVLPKSKP